MNDEKNKKYDDLLDQARQYALDIERHARLEHAQGHLSPTDLALFSRLVMFLRYRIAQDTVGDPEHRLE